MQKLVRTLWAETGTTKENPNASARVIFELSVPDSARTASGYPRREEIKRMTKLIEDTAMGRRLEVEMAEFAG